MARERRTEEQSICRVGPSILPGFLAEKTLLEACKEGLCGLVGSSDCPIVEEESCHVKGAVDGFSLRSPFRDGSVEAKGEEEWVWEVA